MAALQFGPRKNSGISTSPSFKTNIENEDLLHYSHAFQTFFLDSTFWQNEKNIIFVNEVDDWKYLSLGLHTSLVYHAYSQSNQGRVFGCKT